MEFKTSFENSESEQRSMPRLAAEDGSIAEAFTIQQGIKEVDADDGVPADAPGNQHELEGPIWHAWVFALAPLLAVLLGGAYYPWARGMAALLLGLVMLAFPVRRRLPKMVLIALVGVMLAPLLAFLPQSISGTMPWRDTLTDEWGLQLGNRFTPQPWVTFEAWAGFASGMLWLSWCIGRGFSQDQRSTIVRVLAGGGIVICGLTILEGLKLLPIHWWPRHTDWGHGFGPFPNRNHISSLAAITSVLCAASAYEVNRRKERSWILFALGFFVPAAVIFMNTSRAGLILLFVGMTLWLGLSAMRRGFFRKMAVTTSIVLMIVTTLFVSQGGVLNRMQEGGSAALMQSGTRATLYRHTLQITSAAPWLGMGFGNFDTVFAIASGNHDPVLTHDPRSRALHPESTVLTLLAEGGLSTFIPCLLLIVWLLRSSGPWVGKKTKDRSRRHDRRIRNSAAIGVLLGLLHSAVDVPMSNLAFFAVIALLAGTAVRPRHLPHDSSLLDKSLMVGAGGALMGLGLAWTMVAFGNPVLPGSSSARMLRMKARDLANSGAATDALPLIDRAISMRPLDFTLYFERAEIRLVLRQDYDSALLDFTRARMLEPFYAYMCYTEGLAWLASPQPENAILGWREFLRRFPAAGPGVHGYYRQMINHTIQFPELREQVWKLSGNKTELQLDYLTSVSTREEFERCLREILLRSPDLTNLETIQRTTLFDLWSRLGDPDTLMAAIESNKSWERDGGWKLLSAHYAGKSDFKRACELASIYLPSLLRTTPGTSMDVQALERAFLFNPLDARLGVDLFQAYKNRNELDLAIRTLEKVRSTPHPPAYLHQEMAAIHMAKEDYRRAWECFNQAMSQPVNNR